MLVQSLLAAITLAAYVHGDDVQMYHFIILKLLVAHAEPLTPFSNHPMEVARRQARFHPTPKTCTLMIPLTARNEQAPRNGS